MHEISRGENTWLVGWTLGDIETYAWHMEFMPYAAIAVVVLFVGEEFSSGAVRNKLIAGHSRTKLYFGWFITSYAGLLMIHFFSELAGLGFCLIRYGTGYYTMFDGDARALLDYEFQIILNLNAAAVVSAAESVGIALICVIAAGRKATGAAAVVLLSFISDIFLYDEQSLNIMTDNMVRNFIKMLTLSDPRTLTELAFINSYDMSGGFTELFLIVGMTSVCVFFTAGVILMNKRDLR